MRLDKRLPGGWRLAVTTRVRGGRDKQRRLTLFHHKRQVGVSIPLGRKEARDPGR